MAKRNYGMRREKKKTNTIFNDMQKSLFALEIRTKQIQRNKLWIQQQQQKKMNKKKKKKK